MQAWRFFKKQFIEKFLRHNYKIQIAYKIMIDLEDKQGKEIKLG